MIQLNRKEAEVLLYLLRSIRTEELNTLFDGQDRNVAVDAIAKESCNLNDLIEAAA